MTKRILVTGMTAQHYSPVVVERSASFTQALVALLRESGHAVHIAQPNTAWDSLYLQEYDYVLLGISAPMALSSNGVYGALSTISKMSNSDKITFFVDSPEHWQIFANLKAITKNPESLFKSFYSRRSGYFSAKSSEQVRNAVLDGVRILSDETWRTTLYPVLPWSDEQHLTSNTPENARASFVGVSVDSALDLGNIPLISDRSNRWFVENLKSRWTQNVVSSLSFPSFTTKDSKLKTDEQIVKAMSESSGVLIGPGGDKKFWWSPRYVQALGTGTPVSTEWKDSCSIGQAWNHLAVGIEEMSQIDRYELAVTQRKEYFDSISDRQETANRIRTLIGMK